MQFINSSRISCGWCNAFFPGLMIGQICTVKILVMKYFMVLLLMTTSTMVGCAQNNAQKNREQTTKGVKIGGSCEGCAAIYESPVPFDQLSSMVRLPDADIDSPFLAVNGTVYHADGTPAAGVIIYIYHTDQTGVYPTKGDEKGWAKRHGYLRGWMKTDEKGFYKFFTTRPAPYPGRKDPAHIHVIIKEPDKNEYWIDPFVFDDDPLLDKEQRNKMENRGGSGLLLIKPYYVGRKSLKSERNIYLGRNIPGYPQTGASNKSGFLIQLPGLDLPMPLPALQKSARAL